MYKKKIEQYIEAHKQEMLDDICALCSINSERSAYQEGDPFGEGPSRALAQALKMAEEYGFSINNYDNYVGTADLNDGEHQLDMFQKSQKCLCALPMPVRPCRARSRLWPHGG